MNKSAILASAVALVMSGSAIAAGHGSSATVYGKSRAVIKILDNDTGMDAGSTRFGFKGSEDLGGGMAAIYQLEMGYKHVDGGAPAARNGFVGVKGDFGKVTLGKVTPPRYALAEGYFDWSMSAKVAAGGSKTAEAIVYDNKFGDARFMAMLTSENGDDDVVNGTSFGISLPVGPVTLIATVESDVGADGQEQTDLGVVYNAGALSAGAAIIDNGGDEDLLVLQASYKAGATKFIAQIADIDDFSGQTFGIHHSLSKRTTVLLELNGGDYDDHTGIGINHNF